MSDKQSSLMKVKLSGTIQHNGNLHYSGETVEMEASDANRLIDMQIADLVNSALSSETETSDIEASEPQQNHAEAKKLGKK